MTRQETLAIINAEIERQKKVVSHLSIYNDLDYARYTGFITGLSFAQSLVEKLND